MSQDDSFWFCDLGPLPYDEALQLQLQCREKRREEKIPNLLLLTEHPATYTMGRQDASEDLLNAQSSIPLIKTNRGGRITYHGPGQLVGYFIVSLSSVKMNIPQFVSAIEEILIRSLRHYGIEAGRDAQYPGVWVGSEKIAALGLHFDRGVSLHGFSLNLNPDLDHYQDIIPCGIADRGITSLKKLKPGLLPTDSVKPVLLSVFTEVFQQPLTKVNKDQLFILLK